MYIHIHYGFLIWNDCNVTSWSWYKTFLIAWGFIKVEFQFFKIWNMEFNCLESIFELIEMIQRMWKSNKKICVFLDIPCRNVLYPVFTLSFPNKYFKLSKTQGLESLGPSVKVQKFSYIFNHVSHQ